MSKQNIFTSLISLIPLSYIIGNFILNLNVVIIILAGFFLYNKGERLKFNIIDKLMIFAFLYIILTGLWNTTESYFNGYSQDKDLTIINKSLLFLRYIFLYFAVRLVTDKEQINYKILFYSFGLLSLFVSIDIIFQFFNGKDIFGFISPFTNKLTGPFHTEAIAGGFIQKFSFFLFFGFILLIKINDTKIKILILTLLFFVTILSIILSGNRMSLMLFLFGIFLVFLNTKTLRKYILLILVTISLMVGILFSVNESVKNYYNGFYVASKNILSVYSNKLLGSDLDIPYETKHTYLHEFESGFSTWKLNKYIGGGLKSFRYNCPKRKIEAINVRTTCNIHPHNYYLEILSDLGVIGLILFLSIIIMSIIKSFIALKNEKIKYILSPFFYVFIAEVFPIRASGSFFTTNNATVIFLLLAIIISLSYKVKKNN